MMATGTRRAQAASPLRTSGAKRGVARPVADGRQTGRRATIVPEFQSWRGTVGGQHRPSLGALFPAAGRFFAGSRGVFLRVSLTLRCRMAAHSLTDNSPSISPSRNTGNPATAASRLTPLTGLRFLAALHIFVFHIAAMPSPDEMQAMAQANAAASESAAPAVAPGETAPGDIAPGESTPQATAPGEKPASEKPASEKPAGGAPAAGEGGGGTGPERGLYRALPAPLAWLIKRGFVSTGLFFLLSGLVLAYLYVDGDGRQTVSTRDFLLGRWVRLYPLHVAVLPLVLPMLLGMLSFFPATTLWGVPVSTPAFVGATGLMSLALVQAWCPEAALTWNFATWALSTVTFFYVMFPLVVRLLRGWSRPALWTLFWLLPLLNLIPTCVFLSRTDGNSMTNYFWSEFVMRTPLFWLPHFVMAVVLCRLCHISRHDPAWQSRPQPPAGPGWGDLAAILLLIVMMTPDSVYQGLFRLGSKPPNFVLRHGLLAPLICLLLHELAVGRGWLARLLSHRWLATLGEASFGIFILQGPMLLPALFLFGPLLQLLRPACERWFGSPEQATNALEVLRVTLTVLLVVGLSLVSLRWFERPVARWLRRKLALPASAS